MSIGQICNVYTGGEAPSNCVKGPNPTDKYPYAIWANGREVYGYTDSYKIEDDSVCISSIGANTGDVFFHKGKFTPIIRLKVLVPIDKNQLNIRYLYHAMCNHKFDTKKSSVPNMNSDEIKAVIIPVPSIELQNRIAYTLDNFDAICSDLNIGLPAEISARNKQYEYYRDRLLTFNLDVSGDSELVRGGVN